MEKIKILAIAPYEGLKDLINDVAQDMQNIEVHALVADMLEGVEAAKAMQYKGYDAIMSRAGTAELIREITELPVVDIKLSAIDMMRSIKLAQNYSGKFAIVGYKSITETANMICELLQYDVEIKTISDISDIDASLLALKDQGISLIVGDVITSTHAKVIGLNTILVTSGRKNVINAFDEVIKMRKTLLKGQERNLLVKSILEKSSLSVVAFSEDRRIVYSSIYEDMEDYDQILFETTALIEPLQKDRSIKVIKRIGSHFFNIRGELIESMGTEYFSFYLENQRTAVKPFDDAVSYRNVTDSPQINFETFSTSNEMLKNAIHDAKTYAAQQTPIVIYGSKGTGRDSIAHTIYQNSSYHKNPMIVINSKYMNEKKWINIFESENSLFTDSGLTIYIKNLHLMDESTQKLFEAYIRNTSVHKRNRLIFSCTTGYSKTFDSSTLLYFIRNELNALPLVMPGLNQRIEDIPSLTSLYLSELSQKHGKQVIGLEPEAMKLLQEHNWVSNVDQFKRVIEELIILTDAFYITLQTTQRVLSYEALPKSDSYVHSLDLNKSLDDINKDIINHVLAEEDFNQSKAAERLGISRSTLWRKIK